MSLIAAILLLISASTHAGWNFLGKKQNPTTAFFLVANTIGVFSVLLFLPYYWNRIPLVPPSVWVFLVMAGLFLAAYMAALAGAYRTGDMSLAYPLARSSPVIVVAFVTLVLGKGHEVGSWCILGIVLVVAGCFVLPMKEFRDFRLQNYLNLCCLLAVVAALGTAGYTIVDDEALRRLRELPVAPFDPIEATLTYVAFEGISCSLWLAVFVLFSARERRSFSDILRFSKGSAALTGIAIYLTYGLVLVSMAYVKNVSYVAAFRQLSIPLGAILGIAILKEPRHFPKVIGVATIFVGLILVGAG